MRRLFGVTSLVVGCLLAVGCGNGNGAGGDGGAGSGGGGAAGGGGGGGGTPGGGGPHDFPSTSVFYQDVSGAALDGESATVMAALQSSGWGGSLGIDTSFAVLAADASVTPRPFTPTSSQIDCDTAPVPVPPGGHIEGVTDYSCTGGDCHLLVYQGTRLYELYQADITGGMATGGTFSGNCLVIWDLTKDYWANPATVGPSFSRGDGCNGADAGDMPMAALILKTADIQAGVVNHAMRFTLPNSKIRANVYLHPATHLGGPSGGATTLPYGARLRLKASYDLTKLPSDAARVVAKALQKYGMFLADGGNPYISATDDIASVISPSALRGLQPQDFEWVDGGTRVD
ncbi:MAG TPA: hypothetical protein VF997_00035, partial [Polyangia bacterium]